MATWGSDIRTARVVLLNENKDSALFLKRSSQSQHEPGAFELPGGVKDPGDVFLRRTAIRETLEETGVKVSIGRLALIDKFQRFDRDKPNKLFHTNAYLAKDPIDIQNQEIKLNKDEHTDYQMLSIEDAAEQLSPLTFDTHAVLISLRLHLGHYRNDNGLVVRTPITGLIDQV